MAKDRVLKDIGPKKPLEEWFALDWQAANKRVKNLRRRIYRATEKAQWKKVHSLMKLMLRSHSNLLTSVRRVTQDNKGKNTPGIDGQVVLTPKAKMALVRNMSEQSLWQARPVRRVYIPKKDGRRPLGIPTVKNRVAQAMLKNALEPSWEARFETNSYGFRPGRSCHDGICQCWSRLNRRGNDRWVLDADIKGAFDNISHDHLMRALGQVPGRELVRHWLRAGFVEKEMFNPTTSGVPQGGIISPLLANVALDGMERLLKGKFGFIRYADDFVVTAKTKEKLSEIVPVLEGWLLERGLTMHEEKTKIAHIQDGFNFLGFTLRHFDGKCIIKPQKDKVLTLLRGIREWLKAHKQIEAVNVIRHLNPILIGWTNYYKRVSAKDTFNYVAHELWKALWRWCLWRHPTKSKDWVRRRYFGNRYGGSWCFQAIVPKSNGVQVLKLLNLNSIPIERHVKVRGNASPDNPDLTEYWTNRETRGTSRLLHPRRTKSAKEA